jgi:Acetyltransferase (GNAT) domain
MSVYEIDAVKDIRWSEFINRHQHGSIFHTPAWLTALHRTYGYKPFVLTTTPPDEELKNGVVFCRINSWLTGKRVVSVPFSDHCQPLVDNQADFEEILAWLQDSVDRESWKYVELRPAFTDEVGLQALGALQKDEAFYLQVLDIRPDLNTLFHNFHKSCVQRKIHRAEREQLTCEESQSEVVLKKFYSLLLLTRRRHQLPPQPYAWFRNLVACLGASATVRVASKDKQPVASILTIQHKNSLVYKYGCSDARFNNLGGTALLFWKAIQDGKRHGAERYDLGRSEIDNRGLTGFKENWGAISLPLRYYRMVSGKAAPAARSSLQTRIAKSVFAKMPDSLLTATGSLLYRHIG